MATIIPFKSAKPTPIKSAGDNASQTFVVPSKPAKLSAAAKRYRESYRAYCAKVDSGEIIPK